MICRPTIRKVSKAVKRNGTKAAPIRRDVAIRATAPRGTNGGLQDSDSDRRTAALSAAFSITAHRQQPTRSGRSTPLGRLSGPHRSARLRSQTSSNGDHSIRALRSEKRNGPCAPLPKGQTPWPNAGRPLLARMAVCASRTKPAASTSSRTAAGSIRCSDWASLVPVPPAAA